MYPNIPAGGTTSWLILIIMSAILSGEVAAAPIYNRHGRSVFYPAVVHAYDENKVAAHHNLPRASGPNGLYDAPFPGSVKEILVSPELKAKFTGTPNGLWDHAFPGSVREQIKLAEIKATSASPPSPGISVNIHPPAQSPPGQAQILPNHEATQPGSQASVPHAGRGIYGPQSCSKTDPRQQLIYLKQEQKFAARFCPPEYICYESHVPTQNVDEYPLPHTRCQFKGKDIKGCAVNIIKGEVIEYYEQLVINNGMPRYSPTRCKRGQYCERTSEDNAQPQFACLFADDTLGLHCSQDFGAIYQGKRYPSGRIASRLVKRCASIHHELCIIDPDIRTPVCSRVPKKWGKDQKKVAISKGWAVE